MLNGKLEHLGYDGRGVDEECDLLNDLIITEVSVDGRGEEITKFFSVGIFDFNIGGVW